MVARPADSGELGFRIAGEKRNREHEREKMRMRMGKGVAVAVLSSLERRRRGS